MSDKKTAFSLGRLFYKKNFVILFSFIAAIIFWMVITITQSPDSENTISGLDVSIPIKNSVVSELGLDVIGDISNYKASVTVKGPAYVVSSLSAKDVAVTATISNVTNSGTYELELRAAKQSGNLNNEFEISSVSPSTISVTFDYIDTKQFIVVPQAIGASAVEGLVAESPIVSDSNNATLTFKGARTEIGKIDKVVATANVDAVLSTTQSFDSSLKVYEASGKEIDTSEFTITTADGLSAPDVKITVPISKVKTVPVLAVFKNIPGVYKTSPIEYQLNYPTIDIIGPPDTVENINSIQLSEINFDNISSSNRSFTASPVLPDGIKSVDNIDSVTVNITGCEGYTEKVFTVSSVSLSGTTGSGLSASLTRNIKNVKICGPKTVLKNLKNSDFYAVIDVDGQTKGEHTVTARILCKSSNQVWQVGSYTASIDVK